MRILVVHNFYQDLGGEDVIFEQEAKELSINHTVETLSFKNEKKLKGLIQFLLYPYNFLAARKLQKKIDTFRPDIIHIHNTHYASGPILFKTAQKNNIPTSLTINNYRLLCPSATLFHDGTLYMNSIGKSFPFDAVKKGVLDNSIFKTLWTAFTYWLHKKLNTWTNVSAYITNSQFTKNLILEGKLNIKPEQIFIKPNFVIPSPLADQNIAREDYFLYVGRLTLEKGIHQLLKTFAETSLPLRVIGEGPERKTVSEFSEKYDNIKYLGFKNKTEIDKELAKCKALIMPSIWFEGFPMTLLEALSAKTPVVVSEIIGVSEIIEDSINGFKFNPYNFKDKLLKINQYPDLNQVGLKGYETFINKFTKESVMKCIEKVNSEMIK